MKQYKWNAWFILSTIWLLSFFSVTMIAHPHELQQLGRNWLFVGGYILSLLNIGFCVYIGSRPSEEPIDECVDYRDDKDIIFDPDYRNGEIYEP